ncbi:MAG: PepSY-associated TM helix domain-containing protein [Pseudomonadota bacterium]
MAKIRITEEFRASMNWLHTWAGIAVSCLLFAIFWMGSLTVFDREIDQWMKPEMRVVHADAPLSYGAIFDTFMSKHAPGASYIDIRPPNERNPLGYYYVIGADDEVLTGAFDPATSKPIELTESFAGTDFFFPFHYSLHISPLGIGYWLVGFCAMAMLVLIVSGIFIHRKIVKDFFTFQPKKALRRSSLDLHNMSSLVALPLHILFPLTGLMIFFSIYLPWSSNVVFAGDEEARVEAAFAIPTVEASDRSGPADIDIVRIVSEAESRWAERTPGSQPKADSVRLHLANDANAYVVVRETFPSRAVSMNKNITAVSVADGSILADVGDGPAKSSYAWLAGAHFIQFDSWALRWLYFAGGLLGSLMIASGLIFWMQSRIRKGVVEPRSVRVVRGLAVGSISGIILASAAYLVANRLIPVSSDGYGMGRAMFEVVFFYIVWIGTFLHAAVRGQFAWREQCFAIALTAVSAVVLNWVTTRDHPIAAASQGLTQIWTMDLTLLVGAGMAVFAASKLKVSRNQMKQASAEIGDMAAEAQPAE